jgi:hypothetical protein
VDRFFTVATIMQEVCVCICVFFLQADIFRPQFVSFLFQTEVPEIKHGLVGGCQHFRGICSRLQGFFFLYSFVIKETLIVLKQSFVFSKYIIQIFLKILSTRRVFSCPFVLQNLVHWSWPKEVFVYSV